jgi:hypothetical protein
VSASVQEISSRRSLLMTVWTVKICDWPTKCNQKESNLSSFLLLNKLLKVSSYLDLDKIKCVPHLSSTIFAGKQRI